MMICEKTKCTCLHQRLLYCIEKKENEEAIRILEDLSNGPVLRDKTGCTLLHYSVRFANSKIAQYLLEHNYRVDAQNSEGSTPLMLAVVFQDHSLIRVLLKHKANIYLANKRKISSLDIAVYYVFSMKLPVFYEHLITLEMFIDRANEDFEIQQQLQVPTDVTVQLALVAMGSSRVAEFVLNKGYPMGYRSRKNKLNALRWSMVLQKPEKVALLLDHQVDLVRAIHGFGKSYISSAASADEEKTILKMWLRFIRKNFYTSEAFQNKSQSQVGDLLVHGTKEDISTVLEVIDCSIMNFRTGCTFLHLIMDNLNEGILLPLQDLRIRLDVNARRADGVTPLLTAAFHHSVPKIEFLLDYGANVNARTFNRQSVLCRALLKADTHRNYRKTLTSTWEVLLQNGANIQWLITKKIPILDLLKLYPEVNDVTLAHLALLGADDEPTLASFIRHDIESNPKLKAFFDSCTAQLEQMKHIQVHGPVTLFKLLTEKDDKLATYARNSELVAAFERTIESSLHLELYYLNGLRRRMTRALSRIQLENVADGIIERLTGFCRVTHFTVIRQICSCLSLLDLKILCN